MILETEAFKFVEAFSVWWMLVPTALALVFFLVGFLLKQGGLYHSDTSYAFIIGGLASISMGTVFTAMIWGIAGDTFNEEMFAEDTRKLGFEQVEMIEHEESFVGSKDGEFITCAMLESDEEKYKYRLLCDN